jgi:hypothetical protein
MRATCYTQLVRNLIFLISLLKSSNHEAPRHAIFSVLSLLGPDIHSTLVSCSLFYGAFSVTRLYSVDDRVTSG